MSLCHLNKAEKPEFLIQKSYLTFHLNVSLGYLNMGIGNHWS